MEDTGPHKSPLDRPPKLRGDDRSKKKKIEEDPGDIMDDHMEEREADIQTEMTEANEQHRNNRNENDGLERNKGVQSYKKSLMGFNGTMNGGVCMETEELFGEEEEREWALPEPSEEIKKLKGIYPEVPIIQEEFNEWCRPWNYSLIITVLGRKYNLYMLKSHLSRIWGFTEFELIDIPNNYFVVKFTSQDTWRSHYRKVLYDGRWMISQQCILVQWWSPYFQPFQNQLRRIVTWVRIPEIPMHCYNASFITRLGERIRRTLKIDVNTLSDVLAKQAKVERGRYARLCVELDLQKKLVPQIIAAGSIFNVEYEGLGMICFECGRYCHRRENCPHRKTEQQQQDTNRLATTVEPLPHSRRVSDEPFGPWMFISRPNKAWISRRNTQIESQGAERVHQRRDNGGTGLPTRSRFAVLGEGNLTTEEAFEEKSPRIAPKWQPSF